MANISETQLQAFRTLQRFSDFAATHGEKAVARLDGQDGASLTASATDRAYKCIRSGADKRANDQIRMTLKRALCEMFGQNNEFRLENLPESVKENLKISDFGENGGHPLLARRITQIMNAVKASGEWQAVKTEAEALAAHAERMRVTAESVRNEMTDAFRDVKDDSTFDVALAKVLDNADSAFRKALGGELSSGRISTIKFNMKVVCDNDKGYCDSSIVFNHLKQAYNEYVRPGAQRAGGSIIEKRDSEVRETAIDEFLTSLAEVVVRLGTIRRVKDNQQRLEDAVFDKFGVNNPRNPFRKPLDYESGLTKPALLDKIIGLGKNSTNFRMLMSVYMPNVDQRRFDAFFECIAEYIEENAIPDQSFDPETDYVEKFFATSAKKIRNGIGDIVNGFIESSAINGEDAGKASSFLRTLGEVIARATVDMVVSVSVDGE